ncbi:MAG: inositol phosphorylceramide synthase [Actinobacteria bacterium]|nr:MAG: inositol phosphorylceramide synthase [Actinomycetota bacterium]
MWERAKRVLPKGPGDLFLQLAIWSGFGVAYQIARGIADRDIPRAFSNGLHVVHLEQTLHTLIEPNIQRVMTETGGLVLDAANWTYWLSQFVVLAIASIWVYLRHNEVYAHARNWVLTTNLLALVGYVVIPTAPPRMFPEFGFTDTLAASASLHHGSGIIELASNQFAAMPSIHAADALIVGFIMASVTRSKLAKILWTLWPSWVWFSVMATGNHYWFDIAAGVAVAMAAGTLVTLMESRRGTLPAALASQRRW